MKIISVDPGDVHVGVAEFGIAPGADTTTFRCNRACEMSPSEYAHYVHSEGTYQLQDLILVMESWRLYGSTAATQVGSDFGAVQLIGFTRYAYEVDLLPQAVDFTQQPATIKKPTLAWAKVNGYEFTAVKERAGGHAKDAETHGLRYILDRGWSVEQGSSNA